MTYLLKLKFADESAWLVLYRAHLADEVNGEWLPKPGVQVVVIGEVRHTTGNMVDAIGPGGTTMSVPETVPVAGYLVDAIMPDVPEALLPLLVNPVQPRHVWAGNHVLAMPEQLPEAEEVAMVTRGIGAQVPDDMLARIELQLLRGRITPDMAEDRRAWVEAGIAIAESRAALAQARQEREKAVEDARGAAAERTRLLSEREAEIAKRMAAADAMSRLTGKARADEAAKRDAATAMAATLADAAAAQASALAVAMAARDAAAATLADEATKIAAARTARDTLKAAIK